MNVHNILYIYNNLYLVDKASSTHSIIFANFICTSTQYLTTQAGFLASTPEYEIYVFESEFRASRSKV